MIIFLAGMQRSGSTFSFNIVRDLVQPRGSIVQEARPDSLAAIARSGAADYVLLKAHAADDITIRLVELGAIKVICTIRRPEDSIASWMETFGFDLATSVAHMQDWLTMFARIRAHALVLNYRLIDLSPWLAARKIAGHICPDAGAYEVFRTARRHSKSKVKIMADALEVTGSDVEDIAFSYYDKNTFFHRRHVSTIISRPAASRIGAQTVDEIRKIFKAHIDANGELI
jgi:hypothetical protein